MKHLRLAAAAFAAALLVTACADAGSITNPERAGVQAPRRDTAPDSTNNRENGGMFGGGGRTTSDSQDSGGMGGSGGVLDENGGMAGGGV